MAPEQATNSRGPRRPGGRTFYSLGAILYEMLTGRPPFQAPTKFDTLLLVLETGPRAAARPQPQGRSGIGGDLLAVLAEGAEAALTPTRGKLAEDLEERAPGRAPVGAAERGGATTCAHLPARHPPCSRARKTGGCLWMWHSLKIFLLCVVDETGCTGWEFGQHGAYLALWSIGLINLGGDLLAVAPPGVGRCSSSSARSPTSGPLASPGRSASFVLEVLLGMEALFAVAAASGGSRGMVFVVKAGMLSGAFYLSAAATLPDRRVHGPLPGRGRSSSSALVSAVCFFVPGPEVSSAPAGARSGRRGG